MRHRSGTSSAGFAALAVALLLVSVTVASGLFVAGAAATPGGSDPTASVASGGSSDVRVVPPTQCFAGEGYPISIGDQGPAIKAIIHLSVLTDPAAGNEFGIEAAGTLAGDPIVTLGAGVRLTAREALANGIDPFAAFDVLYAYELQFPMFAGSIDDPEYRDDGSPIDSSAGSVPC
ncbi:DUF7332 family protein [Halorubrum sp. N11]|uniref:DUF7332 family protein n=1 Tax=Halorubrum sp. N11 TaxID=3402276 RepID=UPI003EC1469F